MLDQFRELRFLLPPFFFFAWLIWGAYLDTAFGLPCRLLKLKDAQAIVIAGIGAATIPVGFLIGVISIMAMGLISRLFRRQQWDVPYTPAVVQAMWEALRVPRVNKLDLQAVSTFDRVVASKEILDWLVRRWTAFIVSVNSIVAVILALIGGRFVIKLHPGRIWYFSAVTVCLLLAVHAGIAWKETRGMGKLQTSLANGTKTQRFE